MTVHVQQKERAVPLKNCSALTKATFRTIFLWYTAELSRYGCCTVTGLNTKKFGRMPMADNRYGTVRSPTQPTGNRQWNLGL